MHFDDRLATVLRHRASGERAARTQFRQLLDLLGSRKHGRDESMLAAAWLRLGALGEAIPAPERAAMIAEPGWRFRNPELALHLAEDEPEVAVAALGKADLAEEDWAALIGHLPVRARGFLRLRRDLPQRALEALDRLGVHDRGLPQPDVLELSEPAPEEAATRMPPVPANDAEPDPVPDAEDDSAIGALVRRIEAFQKARSAPRTVEEAPRLPLGEELAVTPAEGIATFAFTTDAEGRIDWAERGAAPMVVGTRLRDRAPEIFDRRLPVRSWATELEGAPAIAGEWTVDANPRFTDPGGRFYGYAGKFRRPAVQDVEDAPQSSEADRIRQLLHELKTPVNAIQGFAEVIQQQLFGPTPHEYRALAASIAGDAARMLAGFDELDRLARLETGALELERGESALAPILVSQIEQLQQVLMPRTASFAADIPPVDCAVALAAADVEALAWRVLATLAAAIGAGEDLRVRLRCEEGAAQLRCELPASLAAREDLFASVARPSTSAVSAGMFGAGFALRLARAEAQAAGGDLLREEGEIVLRLPLLTPAQARPSADRVGFEPQAQPG